MGHRNDNGSSFNDQDMDHDHPCEQYGEADPSTGRQGVQGNGNGATDFEKNMHKQCLDAMTNGMQGKFARKTSHGIQIQCGGEQQIWMGAIWRNLPLVPAATQAGSEGAGRFDGSNVLEHDPAHQE
eukprot:11214854-Heterocapsa_arctica.AAC.1